MGRGAAVTQPACRLAREERLHVHWIAAQGIATQFLRGPPAPSLRVRRGHMISRGPDVAFLLPVLRFRGVSVFKDSGQDQISRGRLPSLMC